MKLLFDQNLSPNLVNKLADLFPNSNHVFWLDLDEADDRQVRNYALDEGIVLPPPLSKFCEIILKIFKTFQKTQPLEF